MQFGSWKVHVFFLSLTLRDRRKWEVCVDFRGFLQPVRGGRRSSTSTQHRCGLRHGCCLSSRWRVKIVDDYSTNGIVGFHWFVSTLLHQRAPTSAPSVYWKSQLGKFWVVHWHLFFLVGLWWWLVFNVELWLCELNYLFIQGGEKQDKRVLREINTQLLICYNFVWFW